MILLFTFEVIIYQFKSNNIKKEQKQLFISPKLYFFPRNLFFITIYKNLQNNFHLFFSICFFLNIFSVHYLSLHILPCNLSIPLSILIKSESSINFSISVKDFFRKYEFPSTIAKDFF